MPLNSDFKEMLEAFNAQKVEYLIVGGYAYMKYVEPRYTKDLDLWIDRSPENAIRVYKALAAFGAPVGDSSPDDFTREGQFFQIGVAPNRIDILTSIPGLEFADAWVDRVEGHFGDLNVWFISLNHLVINKRAAGRDTDLVDVKNLLLADSPKRRRSP